MHIMGHILSKMEDNKEYIGEMEDLRGYGCVGGFDTDSI